MTNDIYIITLLSGIVFFAAIRTVILIFGMWVRGSEENMPRGELILCIVFAQFARGDILMARFLKPTPSPEERRSRSARTRPAA